MSYFPMAATCYITSYHTTNLCYINIHRNPINQIQAKKNEANRSSTWTKNSSLNKNSNSNDSIDCTSNHYHHINTPFL